MEIFQNVPNNRKLTINIERIASEIKAKKKVLIVEARNRLKPLNMFFDHEARKKFYKEELKSGEIFEHNAVDIHNPASSLKYRWCIEGGWKLVLPEAANVPDGEVELYNVRADPYEQKNLAQTEPNRVAQLRELIDGWWPK